MRNYRREWWGSDPHVLPGHALAKRILCAEMKKAMLREADGIPVPKSDFDALLYRHLVLAAKERTRMDMN